MDDRSDRRSGGEVLPQGHLADADDHVDGRAQLVGHIGEEHGVLFSHRLQLRKDPFIPLALDHPPLDPILRKGGPAEGHNGAQPQTEYLPEPHLAGDRMQDQTVIQQGQHIQGRYRVQDPLFVQHEQRQDQDAGHGGDIKEAGLMHAEEKELHQQQPSAQVFVKQVRAGPCDVQEPYIQRARRHQQDHPQLPPHDQGDQGEHPAEHRCDHSQQQVPARLLLRPHCFESSWATRRSSSWGSKGFTR